jgi:hypothetical protein
MKYQLVFTAFVLVYFESSSQRLKGEYSGVFNETYKVDSTSGRLLGVPQWDGSKKIIFNDGQTYSFQYRLKGWPCAARPTIRNCTGTYEVVNDTVILTSRYQDTDFCKVVETTDQGIAKDKIMIIAQYPGKKLSPETFINGFNLSINGKDLGLFRIGDSIYIDKQDISKIFISTCTPYTMEWNYIPATNQSNRFDMTLYRQLNKEDLAMSNYKLLIRKGGFFALNGEHLDVKDSLYSKKLAKRK